MNKLRLVVITQEDYFAIPRNIEKLVTLPDVEVLKIVYLDVRGALVNKKGYLLKGFGFAQGAMMGLKLFASKGKVWLDYCFNGRLLAEKHSVKSVALKYGIPHAVCRNPNADDFLVAMKALNPDVVVSFSAPVVFKPPLLALPRLGCINLHCSHLPEFAGLLPSFWALYKGAQYTGATVHYMDDRIDNGGILAQAKVPIQPGQSMYELVLDTKLVGGELMCGVISKLARGEKVEPRPNPTREDCYYSWPTVEQMIDFRLQGKRFV